MSSYAFIETMELLLEYSRDVFPLRSMYPYWGLVNKENGELLSLDRDGSTCVLEERGTPWLTENVEGPIQGLRMRGNGESPYSPYLSPGGDLRLCLLWRELSPDFQRDTIHRRFPAFPPVIGYEGMRRYKVPIQEVKGLTDSRFHRGPGEQEFYIRVHDELLNCPAQRWANETARQYIHGGNTHRGYTYLYGGQPLTLSGKRLDYAHSDEDKANPWVVEDLYTFLRLWDSQEMDVGYYQYKDIVPGMVVGPAPYDVIPWNAPKRQTEEKDGTYYVLGDDEEAFIIKEIKNGVLTCMGGSYYEERLWEPYR